MSSSTQHLVISKVPLVYKIWFLYFEPFAAVNGAYLLHFQPQTYLRMTHCPTADISPIPSSTLFIMDQLAAQFLCFALIEAFVTRTTSDVKVWKAIFCCMLVCDAACLSALRGLGGSEAYWVSPWLWDAVGWGNFGSSWAALILRILFVLGVGVPIKGRT
jgi:hypothetical protein